MGKVTIITGDALQNDCDILCHQVNLDGIMGGGIAWQIAHKFSSVEKDYSDYPKKKLGEVCFSKTDDYVIANCFSQRRNYETDYTALRECLIKVHKYMDDNHLDSVAFPYKYGCGIASGDWNIVASIILYTFDDKTIKIYKLDKE